MTSIRHFETAALVLRTKLRDPRIIDGSLTRIARQRAFVIGPLDQLPYAIILARAAKDAALGISLNLAPMRSIQTDIDATLWPRCPDPRESPFGHFSRGCR